MMNLTERARMKTLESAIALVLKGIDRGYIKDQSLLTTTPAKRGTITRPEALSAYLKRMLAPPKTKKKRATKALGAVAEPEGRSA